ncbi:MAG: transposase, partial [Phenylobacterium sp.]|nr:transposase [Phenylobacterium sp.]
MAHISLITGPERRRRWRDEEKLAILAEAFSPGAVVTDVARRRDVATSLIY